MVRVAIIVWAALGVAATVAVADIANFDVPATVEGAAPAPAGPLPVEGTPAAVPEPFTLALLSLGAVGLLSVGRRR
jgi:hypothetical protein